MLERTFIHVQGIGEKTERNLWEKGIFTWEHFLNHGGTVFSPRRDQMIRQELESSRRCRGDIRFFQDRLPAAHMWRTFEAFKERAVYLDIETSGGYQDVEEITVIGLYDGFQVQSFVNGINMHLFEMAIAHYDLVITFNGTTFDLPFIRRCFPGISLPPAHIDLRFLLKRLGYAGGLKKVEKALGLEREPDIDGMDGYQAVLLWKAYQWGDQVALDRLIRYNTADIVNLEPIMKWGYQKMKERVLALAGGKGCGPVGMVT